jgi:micrococcal nuclease
MKKAMSLNLMLLVSFMSLATEQITGRVVSVIDGNTLEVMGDDHEMYKILLHGIDCPELDQEFGITARKMLERLVLEKEVLVIIQGKDRLGNRLGIITVNGKSDPRFELLNEGLAWTSEKNPIEELEGIKDKARENSKGLWQEQNPTPPWIFRRQQTMMQFKSS